MRCLVGLAVLVPAALLPGCGGGSSAGPSKPTGAGAPPAPLHHRAPSAQEASEIRANSAQLQAAMSRADANALCGGLITKIQVQVASDAGRGSCLAGVRQDLGGARAPRLSVVSIDVIDPHAVDPTGLHSRGDSRTTAAVEMISSASGRRPFRVPAQFANEQGSWRLDSDILDFLTAPQSGSAGAGTGGAGATGGGEGDQTP